MLSVSEATAIAKDFIRTLFPDALGIRLEEVELSETGKQWAVTLSLIPPGGVPTFTQAITGDEGRLYKTITMDAVKGSVKSMKIRTLG